MVSTFAKQSHIGNGANLLVSNETEWFGDNKPFIEFGNTHITVGNSAAGLNDRIDDLEDDVEKLANELEGLKNQLEGHTHIYLTGKGKGHNSVETESSTPKEN